jgi:GTPase SAR1 family protein
MAAKNLYFAGTAGCGKSTLTNAFQVWLSRQGVDAITVNLDPGVDSVPYTPDVDIRDWIKLSEIMAEHGLGPNGAQIVAADMLALNIKEVSTVIDGYDPDYVLIDTPGQLELFAFRQSSRHMVEELGTEQSALAFLYDPAICRSANGYVSSLLLSATIQFRFPIPMINMVCKSDLLSEQERERMELWGKDYYALFNAVLDEAADAQSQVNAEFLQAMETVGVGRGAFYVSSETNDGLEDLYSAVQMAFEGGEDVDLG